MEHLVAYSESSENDDSDVNTTNKKSVHKQDEERPIQTKSQGMDITKGLSKNSCDEPSICSVPVARSTPRRQYEIEDDSQQHCKKRKLNTRSGHSDTLDLPKAITSMFKDKQRPTDNPALHQNRVRSFPHEEGNWATHVYIPIPQDARLIQFVCRLLEMLLPGEMGMLPEFHASLSRTVVIRYHWIDPLVESLKEELQKIPTSVCEIIDVRLFTNDEKTRTFVCLEMSQEDTELLSYVAAVDACFKDFKLPPYYEDPSFHISVGWCRGDATGRVSQERIAKAKEMLRQFTTACPDLSIVCANRICCRSGNKSFVFHLKEASLR